MTVTGMATRGDWLKSHMDRRGISVRQLADALGVTSKTVYDWRDDRTALSEERVPRLAEVLDVSEVEARRGLGYWVPEGALDVGESTDQESTVAMDKEELLELRKTLVEALERIDRIQRDAG